MTFRITCHINGHKVVCDVHITLFMSVGPLAMPPHFVPDIAELCLSRSFSLASLALEVHKRLLD